MGLLGETELSLWYPKLFSLACFYTCQSILCTRSLWVTMLSHCTPTRILEVLVFGLYDGRVNEMNECSLRTDNFRAQSLSIIYVRHPKFIFTTIHKSTFFDFWQATIYRWDISFLKSYVKNKFTEWSFV